MYASAAAAALAVNAYVHQHNYAYGSRRQCAKEMDCRRREGVCGWSEILEYKTSDGIVLCQPKMKRKMRQRAQDKCETMGERRAHGWKKQYYGKIAGDDRFMIVQTGAASALRMCICLCLNHRIPSGQCSIWNEPVMPRRRGRFVLFFFSFLHPFFFYSSSLSVGVALVRFPCADWSAVGKGQTPPVSFNHEPNGPIESECICDALKLIVITIVTRKCAEQLHLRSSVELRMQYSALRVNVNLKKDHRNAIRIRIVEGEQIDRRIYRLLVCMSMSNGVAEQLHNGRRRFCVDWKTTNFVGNMTAGI